MNDDNPASDVPATSVKPAPMRPGRNGGALRVGNPGNMGNRKPRSAIAREVLEASTPQAARLLKRMSLKGVDEKGEPLTHPDRLKAITAHLDRGGAPAAREISGAGGAPFTVAVIAAVSVAPASD